MRGRKLGLGFAIVLLFILTTFCKREADRNSVEYFIAINPALALRSDASTNGTIVAQMPFNEKVEILQHDGPKATLLGLSGNWVKVKFRDKEGWAFGALLRKTSDKHSYTLNNGVAQKIDSDTSGANISKGDKVVCNKEDFCSLRNSCLLGDKSDCAKYEQIKPECADKITCGMGD